jgi:ABC-type bacteriocin/lantibiotic exporter with double-glycine peptidase domain
MNSVERIQFYSSVEQECDTKQSAGPTAASWPSSGRVEFVGVGARYRPSLPRVLDGVSLSIAAGSKVKTFFPGVPTSGR